MERYERVYLPGCGGSAEVVHMKSSCFPSDDHNCAFNKKGFPTLAFKFISWFDHQVLGISHVQFFTKNDKQIVKLDHNIS